MQLGQAGPYFQAIVTARGAAYKVFLIIDRVKNIYILFKGSWGVLFHLCLVFEIFRSYSCSPATLPNRASAGSLFTLIFLIWSAGVSLLRRINRGKYIKQRTLFISRCTNRQVQRQTITEETQSGPQRSRENLFTRTLKKICFSPKMGWFGWVKYSFLGGLMWLSNQGKYMSVQLPSADLDPRTAISPSKGWNRHSGPACRSLQWLSR